MHGRPRCNKQTHKTNVDHIYFMTKVGQAIKG